MQKKSHRIMCFSTGSNKSSGPRGILEAELELGLPSWLGGSRGGSDPAVQLHASGKPGSSAAAWGLASAGGEKRRAGG